MIKTLMISFLGASRTGFLSFGASRTGFPSVRAAQAFLR